MKQDKLAKTSQHSESFSEATQTKSEETKEIQSSSEIQEIIKSEQTNQNDNGKIDDSSNNNNNNKGKVDEKSDELKQVSVSQSIDTDYDKDDDIYCYNNADGEFLCDDISQSEPPEQISEQFKQSSQSEFKNLKGELDLEQSVDVFDKNSSNSWEFGWQQQGNDKFLNFSPSVRTQSNRSSEDFVSELDKSEILQQDTSSDSEEQQQQQQLTGQKEEEETGLVRSYEYRGLQNQQAKSFELPCDQFDAQTFVEYQLQAKLESYSDGNYRLVCPYCKGGSTHESSFGITIKDDGMTVLWHCFRAKCGEKGGVSMIKKDGSRDQQFKNFFAGIDGGQKKTYNKPNVSGLTNLNPQFEEFFKRRRISEETLRRNQIRMKSNVLCPTTNKLVDAIAFPYLKYDSEGNAVTVNVKFRTIDKIFWQEKDAEPIVFGYLDAIENIVEDENGNLDFIFCDEIYVVEGEMDKLAMEEAGFRNVISVPNGAPSSPTERNSLSSKYDYMENSSDIFRSAQKVIMAVDNDYPGCYLMQDLTQRIGKGKCSRVKFPNNRGEHPLGDLLGEGDSGHRKDANEVLMKDGVDVLRQIVLSAEELPILGVVNFFSLSKDIIRLYLGMSDLADPKSTGWPGLDKFYKIIPGEFTIVTGVPNSGKSEFLDALAVNMCVKHGWKFALASMEKEGVIHGQQLIEKYSRKPFFLRNDSTDSLTKDELIEGLFFINKHFQLIRCEEHVIPNITWLLQQTMDAHLRYGLNGLIIDPYNELDHQRDARWSETEYISKMLGEIKMFAKNTGIHVWLVAHPRQQYQWRGEAPTLYEIAGSAHFINKMDAGVVVHRYPKFKATEKKSTKPGQTDEFMQLLQDDERNVLIRVMKVRNKYAGRQGDYILRYNRANGTYDDIYQEKFQAYDDEYAFPDSVNSAINDDVDNEEEIIEAQQQAYSDDTDFETQTDDSDNNNVVIDTDAFKTSDKNLNDDQNQVVNQIQPVAKQEFFGDSSQENKEENSLIETEYGPVDGDQILRDLGGGVEKDNVDFSAPDIMDQQDVFDSDFNKQRDW